jgi:hypothetical protein
MTMKRLGAGEVYGWHGNDDIMLAVACDKKFCEEHEQQASGAMARMQARCDNALRFLPEVQAVRQRREMAEAMLKGAEQDD